MAGVSVAYAEQVHRSYVGAILADGVDYYSYSEAEWAPCVQEGTLAAKTVDELTPQGEDLVFSKVRASALVGTTLDSSLRARGIRSIVLAGTSVQGCLVQTHYDAHQAGYYPVVVRDAVAPYGADEELLPQLSGFRRPIQHGRDSGIVEQVDGDSRQSPAVNGNSRRRRVQQLSELEASNGLLSDVDALKERMDRDGCLLIRGLLPRDAVRNVRLEIMEACRSDGLLDEH